MARTQEIELNENVNNMEEEYASAEKASIVSIYPIRGEIKTSVFVTQ